MIVEVMVVGPQVFVGPGARISTVYSDIYAIKIFYKTMKYKKMNEGIFIFLCLHCKYFLRGFYAP